ncbi:MAG: TSUP family transporter [Bacteriovoracaceae bacterium]
MYIFLFVAALFAGLIDAIAGGGGMIALPALLSVGVPPQAALGTNKFQSMFNVYSSDALSSQRIGSFP